MQAGSFTLLDITVNYLGTNELYAVVRRGDTVLGEGFYRSYTVEQLAKEIARLYL